MNTSTTKRICLWSGPRNVSTALMYSFAQRSDTRVIDEPLYAAYLAHTDKRSRHPDWQAVMESQPSDLTEAVARGMLNELDRDVYFIKNMALHWRGFPRNLLEKFHHVFLFRHPALVARSYGQVIDAPDAEDLGYPAQLEILSELQARRLPFTGIDSTQLRNDPRGILTRLCEHLGIPFQEAMLHWQPGARPEDGVWAPHWYSSVHTSTGFSPDHSTPPSTDELPENVRSTVSQCLPMWQELSQHAL